MITGTIKNKVDKIWDEIPMLSSPFKILNYQKFVLPPPQS